VPPAAAVVVLALVAPPLALVELLLDVADDPPTEALPPELLVFESELPQAETAAKKNEPKTTDFFIKIPRVSPAPLIPALARDDHAE